MNATSARNRLFLHWAQSSPVRLFVWGCDRPCSGLSHPLMSSGEFDIRYAGAE